MKNNFSNFIKIILIILGIVLLFGIVFYIITKNDTSNNHSNNSTIEPDKNIAVIEENLTTIFSYINNTKTSENIACTTLGNDLGYQINSNENFFNYYAPVIMDCVYNRNYPTLTYDAETSYKIISETEFNTYENYFTNIQEFTSIKDVYTANVLSNLTEEEISIIENYIDGDYKIAYPIANAAEKNNISYDIKRIFKESDYYLAIIVATYNNVEYTGKLKISVINNYPLYSELIFY